MLSLYNLKACQILSTEINKIEIDCTQNATNNNQVLLFNQSIYCGNAYISENKKYSYLKDMDKKYRILKFIPFFPH